VFNSVLGWNCSLGAWARVEGLPVNADPNDPSTHISQKDIFNDKGQLEPSITVLGESVRVADEVMVLHCLVLPHKVLDKDRANEIIL
jgi:mannose-1-phosphate guanylyltransferase